MEAWPLPATPVATTTSTMAGFAESNAYARASAMPPGSSPWPHSAKGLGHPGKKFTGVGSDPVVLAQERLFTTTDTKAIP